MRAVLRLSARVFLALALLLAWQTALEHPVEHVDPQGEFVHLYSGHSDEQGHESGPLCDALAALIACAPHAGPALPLASQPEHSRLSTASGAPRTAEPPPFLSQGPPASA